MNHHYLIDRLVTEHLADLHAEASQARLIRELAGEFVGTSNRRSRSPDGARRIVVVSSGLP